MQKHEKYHHGRFVDNQREMKYDVIQAREFADTLEFKLKKKAIKSLSEKKILNAYMVVLYFPQNIF